MTVTEPDYDVVVVGAGVAGLSAALEASNRGLSVLVAEAGAAVGGSSALSGGIVMAAGTTVQKQAGIDDTVDDLNRDYLHSNAFGVEPSLVRRLAEEAGTAVEWLISLGVEFYEELVYASEEARPRGHVPKGMGAGIIEVLRSTLRQRPGVDVAAGTRVDGIVVNGGRVCGVAAAGDAIRSSNVIVASGGFGANVSMWTDHLPSLTRDGSALWYVGAPHAQGDALGWAGVVGADVTGHDRALVLLTPDVVRELEFAFPGWLLLVDRLGRRRVDESASYSLIDLTERRYGTLFAVFDEAARRACASGAFREVKQVVPGTEGLLPSSWSPDNLDLMTKQGKLKSAGALASLAQLLSVDPEGLAATVERYNSNAELRSDGDYLKEARFLRKVDEAPFYGVELRRGILLLTAKGLRTDPSARVLNRAGRPITGLFAAGECTGGVIGDVYMGSGNSFANCLVFGRTAGRMVAVSPTSR